MATKNNIRRDYLIIRRILQGDCPSAASLLEYLRRHDTKIDPRTFQRDIANIRSNFDIEVIYDRDKNGYYIDTESALEFDKLLYFIGLAESSDIILSSVNEKRELLKYLSISPNTRSKGVENIGVLLQAIRNKAIIQFAHLNYETEKTKEYTVEPYLLKEFGGRWYLFAFVRNLDAFRTFGLDRITNFIVSNERFKREKVLEETVQKFDNVYGLVYEPEQNKNAPIEEVKLQFSPLMIKHLQALSLHHSQTVDKDIVTLQVIINPELENKILSYGENVKVLSPRSLQEKIKQRLEKALTKY